MPLTFAFYKYSRQQDLWVGMFTKKITA